MSSTGTPPPGGDVNRGEVLVAVTWLFTSLALSIIFARLFVRLKLSRNAGWDDVVIVIAMLFSILYTALSTVAAATGQGRHPYYIGPERTSKAIKINSIALIPAVLSFSTPKLAVALLLMRLLNPSRLQRRILYTLTISCIVFSAMAVLFVFVQCSPVTALWNPEVAATATCWPVNVVVDWSIFTGAYSAFVDGYLAIYPLIVLRTLKISIQKKIGLGFVMSLGIVAGCVAIYKCTKLPELADHADYTFATTYLLIWTSVESNIIIIAACLPTLRPLFLFATGKSESSTGSDQGIRKSYPLSPLSKDSARGNRQIYPPSKNDSSKDESFEPILPQKRIRQVLDVTVKYDQKADLPDWGNSYGNVNSSCEHNTRGNIV